VVVPPSTVQERIAPERPPGDTWTVIQLALILAGLAAVVLLKAKTARRPRVFVIASLLGGLAGMELKLLNGALQGGHLSDGGVLVYAWGVPLVPMVAPFLAAGAGLGAVAGILAVLVYRGATATWGSKSKTTA
jgi:hypothetical protein